MTLEEEKTQAEIAKLTAETAKLNAETKKIQREAFFVPLATAAGIVGAAVAIWKALH